MWLRCKTQQRTNVTRNAMVYSIVPNRATRDIRIRRCVNSPLQKRGGYLFAGGGDGALKGVLKSAAAGHLHAREGDGLDIVCGKDLAELFCVIDGVELRAADERHAAFHEVGVEAAAGIGAAIGGDEQIRAVKIRGLDRRARRICTGQLRSCDASPDLTSCGAEPGQPEAACFFALCAALTAASSCRGLTLDEAYRACRAIGQAVAQTVAVIVAHEPGLAVNKPYRALVACVDALAAAVALFLVYLNNSSYHLHCLQLIFTLQHYDIPGVKLAV